MESGGPSKSEGYSKPLETDTLTRVPKEHAEEAPSLQSIAKDFGVNVSPLTLPKDAQQGGGNW